MRRIITNLFLLLIVVTGSLAMASDAVETLIENEREIPVDNVEEIDELPVSFLRGDRNGVELYSARSFGGQRSLLCEPVPFDEWLEIMGKERGDQDVVVNLRMDRLKEAFEHACLIRLGDPVVAVGASGGVERVLTELVLRPEKAVCPNDSPYGLWGRFEPALSETPFFFSTNSDIKTSTISFRSREQLTGIERSVLIEKQLRSVLSDLDDYDLEISSIGASNAEALVFLRRRLVTNDDDGLINEAIYWVTHDEAGVVATEYVDVSKGSGHLRLMGVLDYNSDGLVDVLISGDQFRCQYQLFFEGIDPGLAPVEMPNPACSC